MGFSFTLLVFSGILFLIFITLSLYYWKDNKPVQTSQADITLSYQGFLAPCGSDQSCPTGLYCDALTFTCRLGQNSICNNSFDCIYPYHCSGICVNSPLLGGLDDYCPCEDGYYCYNIPDKNGAYTCKIAPNGKCKNSTDCYSQLCDNGICSSKYPLAFSCKNNQDCQSGWCSSGYCQNLNITTGQIGAACGGCSENSDNLAPCNSGYSCSCENGTVGTNGVTGICQNNILGFQENCYYNGCNKNFTCEQGICGFKINPNYSPNNNCITNMQKSNNYCLSSSSLSCGKNSDCYSNVCSGLSTDSQPQTQKLFRYKFFNSDGGVTGNYFDAYSIMIDSGGPLLTGIKTPGKMFSYTTSNTEYVFITNINSSQSIIYCYSYDQNGGADVRTIFNDTKYGKLTDAAYNGSLFLMVFDNTFVYQAAFNLSTIQLGTLSGFNQKSGDSKPYQYGFNGSSFPVITTIQYIDVSYPNQIESSGNDVMLTCTGGTKFYTAQFATPSSSYKKYYYPSYVGGNGAINFVNYVNGPLLYYNSNGINYIDGQRFSPSYNTSTPINCDAATANQSTIACTPSQNISYVGKPTNQNSAVLFTGNLDRYQYPLSFDPSYYYDVKSFSIYSENSKSFTKTIMLTTKTNSSTKEYINVITVAYDNNFFDLPGYFDPLRTKVLATKWNLFFLTSGGCR